MEKKLKIPFFFFSWRLVSSSEGAEDSSEESSALIVVVVELVFVVGVRGGVLRMKSEGKLWR